ncbi:MAG TPA: LCCL domain-containing protein, partial [Burkholderiaceae bacterium]|nr:LCCL domain-containing protein [Burkholderiaceae bacterium]
MKRAFISHVPENAALAIELCRAIEQAGLACWIAPRDVAPGSEYAEAIVSGIAISPAFVLLLTAGSNRSMFVRHELEHATALGKRIFVVRAESVLLDSRLEPLLSTATEVDVSEPPSTELRWDRLIHALASLPDEGPVPAADPVSPAAPAAGGRSAKGLAWAAAAVVLAAGAWMLFGSGEGAGDAAVGADSGGPGAGRVEQPVASPAGQASSPAVGAAALASPGAPLDRVTAGAIDALVPAIPIPAGPADGSAASEPTAPACPRSFALIPEQDEAFDCHCDESAMRDGLVWGTDFYAPESKLCRAALHAGVIEATGGAVTVEWGGAQDVFVGTERNGVESGDERALARSARFRGAPPPPPGPGPCP